MCPGKRYGFYFTYTSPMCIVVRSCFGTLRVCTRERKGANNNNILDVETKRKRDISGEQTERERVRRERQGNNGRATEKQSFKETRIYDVVLET